MKRNNLHYQPNEGRDLYSTIEWVLIKDSIDAARLDNEDEDARAILISYQLWDVFNDRPCEEAITNLYKEYT